MYAPQTMAELLPKIDHTRKASYLREGMELGDPEASDLTASDASSASVKSSDGYSPSNEPTTSSTSSDSDEDSSQDVEQTIEYLRLKQGILKRASTVLFDHEDAYNAYTARTTSRTSKPNASPGSLWVQAKGFLPRKPVSATRNSIKRSGPWSSRGNKKIMKPNPRDPSIDLDEVKHMDATSFDGISDKREGDACNISGLTEVEFPQGQWMAQGLIRSSEPFSADAHSTPEQCRWRVISDPLTCSLGLVPPASISMQHGTCIEDALAISEEPRLLTQVTPPFCVVYANKAFMILTGIKAKEGLIGRPIESILHVKPEVIGTHRSSLQDDFLSARLLRSVVAPFVSDDDSSSSDPLPCRMMIVPVMNHPTRQAQCATATPDKRHACMTHVLIRIHSSLDKATYPASNLMNLSFDDLFSISDSEKRKDEDSSTSSSQASQDSVQSKVMGTIG